jgi:epoxyqueuosine reductase
VELTKKVKELVLANSLDYVGIASAEALQNEPERHKPSDYLPSARSVVSIGIRLGLGVELSNRLAHGGAPRQTIFPYLWHGFGLPSWQFLDRTALLITRLIEREGYIAVPVMSASTFDIQSSLMEFSNNHAAVAAGLGDLGWSGMVLTPDRGPRARFGSVITNAPLEVDPVYSGPRLCHVDRCARQGKGEPLCMKLCPTKALGQGSEEVIIGARRFKTTKVSRFRCMWGSMGLHEEKIPLPKGREVTVEDIFETLAERDPVRALELMGVNERGDYCGRCLMACPVGASEKVDQIMRRSSGLKKGGKTS